MSEMQFAYPTLSKAMMETNPKPNPNPPLGKAMMEKQAIGVHVTVPLLKLIVGAPITWHDLQYKDQPYYEQMQKMVAAPKEEIEYYCLDFTVPGNRRLERYFDALE